MLHTAAHWLMLPVRDAIPKLQPLALAEFTTLRARLLKIAARITETISRVRIAFAAACPEADLFRHIAHSLQPTGGGYVLELVGYIVGIAAMLAGGFTIWQHTKNPNGQHRMSYGIISVLAGGFFLALSTMAQFSSNTVSGGNATNTGTSQQLTIQ